jgi:hypothetical protein
MRKLIEKNIYEQLIKINENPFFFIIKKFDKIIIFIKK